VVEKKKKKKHLPKSFFTKILFRGEERVRRRGARARKRRWHKNRANENGFGTSKNKAGPSKKKAPENAKKKN